MKTSSLAIRETLFWTIDCRRLLVQRQRTCRSPRECGVRLMDPRLHKDAGRDLRALPVSRGRSDEVCCD